MKTIKAASRHLLFAEFILGWFLVAWATCKGADAKLTIRGLASVIAWVVPFAIGAMQAAIAAMEWFCGKRWPLYQLLRVVGWRTALAGLSALMWFLALKDFILQPAAVADWIVLIMIAPVLVGVNLYSLKENRKVYTALNPDVSSTTLTIDH